MTCRQFKVLASSLNGCFGRATIILLVISMLVSTNSGLAQQVSTKCLETQQAAEVAGVMFVSPQCYKLEQASDSEVAFMRHPANKIALFVAVPDQQIDDNYLTNLSNKLVSQLSPQQSGFSWKILQQASERKVSIFQTVSRTAKGLNAKMFVQVDYVVLKVQGRDIVVGSIATFGDKLNAKFLFDVEGREYSIIGWQGLFQLIASITGERYEDSNK